MIRASRASHGVDAAVPSVSEVRPSLGENHHRTEHQPQGSGHGERLAGWEGSGKTLTDRALCDLCCIPKRLGSDRVTILELSLSVGIARAGWRLAVGGNIASQCIWSLPVTVHRRGASGRRKRLTMDGRDPIHTQPKATGRPHRVANSLRSARPGCPQRHGLETAPPRPVHCAAVARRGRASLLTTAAHQQAKACPLHTARQCTDTG